MSINADTVAAPGAAGVAPGAAADQSIRSYVAGNVPTALADQTVADCRARLGSRTFADASHLFVVDEDYHVVGVVPIGAILSAPPQTALAELLVPSGNGIVTIDTDREQAASRAIGFGLATLAVCHPDGRFAGAVPASALMSILRDEHMEDLNHMAGILSRSDAARAALTAPPHRRALYRLPWLLVGLAGSALATGLMAHFEGILNAKIAVAFFVPAVVYLADAVGTQSEAVAVRGLSLSKASLLSLVRDEFATGILMGAALGAIALPAIWLVFGDVALAATVALALVAASSIATSIGLLLPWIFSHLGYDPALGSGPVATVIQDVLSLAIYFVIAALLIL